MQSIRNRILILIALCCRKGLPACTNPTWLQNYSCQVVGTCTCQDLIGFTDGYGYSCSDYNNNCIGAVQTWGYTVAIRDSVIKNCPKACGICACAPWTGCFSNTSHIANASKHFRNLPNKTGSIVRIVQGAWFSQSLLITLFKIYAEEILGYTIELAQAPNFTAVDVMLEAWPSGITSMGIDKHATERYEVGYNGKEGVYFAGVRYATCLQGEPNCTDLCLQPDVAAGRCADRYASFDIYTSHWNPKANKIFPSIGTFDYLNSSQAPLDRYVPPHCMPPSAVVCMELLHHYTSAISNGSSALIQRLTLKTHFPYHILLVGTAKMRQGVQDRIDQNLSVVFTWYEPEPFLLKVKAATIAFPLAPSYCGDPKNGYGLTIGCDRPNQVLLNVVKQSIKVKAPEIYYALRTSFRISETQLREMMGSHVIGGGQLDTLNDVACNWMKNNQNLVMQWWPPCSAGTQPFVLANNSLSCCNGSVVDLSNQPSMCVPHCNATTTVVDVLLGVCWPRCPVGSIRGLNGCDDCAVGRYWVSLPDPFLTGVVAECRACPIGRHQALPGTSSCELCKVGKFADHILVSNMCLNCAAGRYQNKDGQSICKSCPVGRLQADLGKSECGPCDIGYFANTTGATACISCSTLEPSATTLGYGAEDLQDCSCPRDFSFVGGRCRRCPEIGLRCPGGHPITNNSLDTTPLVKAGYMTLADPSLEVFRCVDRKGRCPHERSAFNMDFMCPSGFATNSPQCAECKDNFYPVGNKCKECDLGAGFVLALKFLLTGTIQALIVLWLFVKTNHTATRESTSIGLVLWFVQVLVQLRALPLKWPAVADSVLSPLSWISMDSIFPFTRVEIKCVFTHTRLSRMLFQGLLPLYPTIMLAFWFIVGKAVGKRMHLDNMFNTACAIHKKFFITITGNTLKLFIAVRMPNNGRRMVKGMPGLEIGGRDWAHLCPFALGFFCLYSLSFVSYVSYLVALGPKLAATRPRFRVRNKFAFRCYREDRWWWAQMDICTSLALVIVQTVAENMYMRIYLTVTVLLLVVVCLFRAQPFKYEKNNYLDQALKICLLILMMLSTSFIDVQNMQKSELDNTARVFGVVCVVVVVFAASICACELASAVPRKAGYKIAEEVHPWTVAMQFRDVMTEIKMLSDREYVRAVNRMCEIDLKAMQHVMQSFVGVFLRKQPTARLLGQRVMPGVPYEIWDPNETMKRTLYATVTGTVQLQMSAAGRRELVLIKVAKLLRSAMKHGERISHVLKNIEIRSTPSDSTVQVVDSTSMRCHERHLSSQLKATLHSIQTHGAQQITERDFCVLIKALESDDQLTDRDISSVFRFVDIDELGTLPLGVVITEVMLAAPIIEDDDELPRLEPLPEQQRAICSVRTINSPSVCNDATNGTSECDISGASVCDDEELRTSEYDGTSTTV